MVEAGLADLVLEDRVGVAQDVEALARSLGLSRRSLERLTAATHGSTPKRLAAKYRALQAAARLAVGDLTDWRDAADAGGYADQRIYRG